MTELSPIRIHLTGFVEKPGDYIVPGLCTISHALVAAGGPSAGGSYRRIRLLRRDVATGVFDLYSLLNTGSRREDALLQPDDVLHIEAGGPQAAVLGSVNRPAVFEFVAGETVDDLLRLAGGFSSVADRSRMAIERLAERSNVGARQLEWPRDRATPLVDGDVVRAYSLASAAVPSQVRNKRVRVEGEVLRPGDYLLAPGATLDDAIAAAGGPTAASFVYGTVLRRERVRVTQETNYERALQELEAEVNRAAVTRGLEQDQGASIRDAANRHLLARLRSRRPDGRMVLDVEPQSAALPALEVEDGDSVNIPPRTQSIGVFGSVFNPGSFVYDPRRALGDYLNRAGGATASADNDGVFVVRANGSVLSARQGGRWSIGNSFEREPALPGDTLFVPEQLDRVTIVQGVKDWTQILYQFGIGIAALLAIK